MVQHAIPHESEFSHCNGNIIPCIFRQTTAFDTQSDGFQHLVAIYILKSQVVVPELFPTVSCTVTLQQQLVICRLWHIVVVTLSTRI